MKKVDVQLDSRDYPIFVEDNLLSDAEFFRHSIRPKLVGRKVCVLTNSTVWRLYGGLVNALFSEFELFFFEMEDGEEFKTLESYRLVICLLYTSPSPRDLSTSRMPSSA